MTADTPTSRVNTLSDRFASLAYDSMQPSLTALLGQQFTNSTSNIGSLVLQQFNTPRFASLVGDIAPTSNISKMISDHFESRVGSLGKALAELHRTQFEDMFQRAEFQSAMLGFSQAFTESVSSTSVSSLLSQAASLQGFIEDRPDVDNFAAEFLDDQPVLTESIERLPFLSGLTISDQQLLVWFIGVVVAIYMTWGILIVSADSPELAMVLSALGVSGPQAGKAAAATAKKLLDKLPEADGEE
ncbi:hypothetical protein ACFVVC_01195 [Pseudarthrobacter sp. NPDC058196]|uniref:hypothetical protein n=1 Tax=Pseudarthrobacter sp. NPDC058196 TaxID=3346376 RepID=UPI0036DA71A5